MSRRCSKSVVLASLLAGFPFVAVQADCSATAAAKGAHITEEGDLIAGFKVKGQPCDAGCKGEIAFRVSYLNNEGEPQTVIESAPWASDDDEGDSVRAKSYRDSCNNNRFGPCRVKKIEVVKVSCSTES